MWPFRRAEPLGKRGERLAGKHLTSLGLTILVRNWRGEAGEVDLVAMDGDELIFVEVKTRHGERSVAPEAAVDDRKRQRYRDLAREYLGHLGRDDVDVRFDVVAVIFDEGSPPRIRHTPDAFS